MSDSARGHVHDRSRGARKADRAAAVPEDLEHGRMGLRVRPDRELRERRRADRRGLGRQPRRRVRGADRAPPARQRAPARAGSRTADRRPDHLQGGLAGEYADVALGGELQPLVPGVARRAAERAARRLLHARPLPAGRRRDRHALRRPHRLVPALLAHARRRRSRAAPGDARGDARLELRLPLPLRRRQRLGAPAGRGRGSGEDRDHDRARRRRARPRAGAPARVERPPQRASPRGRARGRGRDPRLARPAGGGHHRRPRLVELRDRRGARAVRGDEGAG